MACKGDLASCGPQLLGTYFSSGANTLYTDLVRIKVSPSRGWPLSLKLKAFSSNRGLHLWCWMSHISSPLAVIVMYEATVHYKKHWRIRPIVSIDICLRAASCGLCYTSRKGLANFSTIGGSLAVNFGLNCGCTRGGEGCIQPFILPPLKTLTQKLTLFYLSEFCNNGDGSL